MNVITKLMYSIHRILGTLLCILFLMWFLSAFVMMYHRFPRVSAKEKMQKLDMLLRHSPPAPWRKGQVYDTEPQCRTPRVQL